MISVIANKKHTRLNPNAKPADQHTEFWHFTLIQCAAKRIFTSHFFLFSFFFAHVGLKTALVSPDEEMFEALRAKLDTSLKAGQGETIYEVGVGANQDEPGLAGVRKGFGRRGPLRTAVSAIASFSVLDSFNYGQYCRGLKTMQFLISPTLSAITPIFYPSMSFLRTLFFRFFIFIILHPYSICHYLILTINHSFQSLILFISSFQSFIL